MNQAPALSRQFLSDTGGWKEMKAARSLHAAGRVEEASYVEGVLSGTVREGGKTLKVRAVLRSRVEVENHCPCPRARRDGIVCAHALAVGLEVLEPAATGGPGATAGSSRTAGWGGGAAAARGGRGGVPGPARPAGAGGASEEPISPDWPGLVEPERVAASGGGGKADASDETGALAATLHLVLAPGLGSAWAKGRVTLGVEAECGGQRCLLKSLPKGARLLLDEADRALFLALRRLSPGSVPGMRPLAVSELAILLESAVGHPRVSLGKDRPVRVSGRPLRPRLRHARGLRFEAEWPQGVAPLPSETGVWALSGGELLQPVAPGLDPRWQGVMDGGMALPPGEFSVAFAELRRHFEIDELPLRRPPLELRLALEGSLNHLEARLHFRYGGREEPAVPGGTAVREVREEGECAVELPDPVGEAAAVAALEEAGFGRRGSEGLWVLQDKEAILQFLAHGYPRFASRFRLETGERFEHALSLVEPVETRLDFRGSGTDWFAMEVSHGPASGGALTREEVDRLLRSGKASRPLPGGKLAVVDAARVEQLGEVIRDCDPRQESPGLYRVERQHAGYFAETARDLGLRLSGPAPWEADSGALEFYDLSAELDAALRPYQREGLAWMRGLASRGMGGILADDMGLGKTLQAIALIYSVGGAALVVCPSSLVFNWVDEVAKFAPDLKAVAVEGTGRAAVLSEHADADVFVTSYALLRRDEAVWAEREFDVVVLDEAQQIKNPEAQVSRVAHRLRGTHRFALTGTPIENSVKDLWSIARFALPGYLGSRAEFAERFEKPLAAGAPPAELRERLARRLRPVVLRRLKHEVASELPEKIEQVVVCDLSPRQRAVYERLLQEGRGAVLGAEGGRRRLVALTALLRLRQACCDLRLLGLGEEGGDAGAGEDGGGSEEAEFARAGSSAKLAAFFELVDEAVAGGHRILVFSQFVGMLQLVVPELLARGLRYCYLDGSTKDRGEEVKRFQEGDAPLFLISLKAGGVGLNLTAADTVVHLDPWWNPAVEAQATDRAHRIGQVRVVTAYKLIARGTVEEKILALQNRKREIAGDLLSQGDGSLFDEGDLMDLLEG